MPHFLLLAIATSLISYTVSSTPLSDAISNVFDQFNDADQEAILHPDQAFIVSAQSIAENIIHVRWEIAKGYYLYKDKFNFSFSDNNITVSDIQLPEGKQKLDPNFGDVQVYYYNVNTELTIKRSRPDITTAELLVTYQGCKEDTLCYPPTNKSLPLELTTAGIAVSAGRSEKTGPPQQSVQNNIAEHLFNDDLLKNIIAFFGFGLLLSLTPCVFPMIPILSGIIVGQGRQITVLHSFYISLAYVFAVALTYAVLGIIAGSFAINLQATAQNVWVITTFSLIFVLLALSMFGFYELRLPIPDSWQSKLSNTADQQSGSLKGAFIMGILSAIIVGPCIAPPLAAALLYISQTGDAVLGGLTLFSMALGMSVPLLMIGTSAGKLLPRSGTWMESVKHIFGVLMLATAIWFMGRVLPAPLVLALWALLLIVCSVYMGVLDKPDYQSPWQKLWRGLGLVMLIYGIICMIGAANGGNNILQPLQGLATNYADAKKPGTLAFKTIKDTGDLHYALEQAGRDNKPVMLDFYADWCITCKEMEHGTFADMNVHQSLQNFVLLQADVTKNDTADKQLLQKFDLYGPPAILFFDKQGAEQKPYRVIGFMDSNTFLKHIQQLNNT